MNIHEYQAKKILKEYGAPISKGTIIHSKNEIKEKIKNLKSRKFVVKAQIHAGGRGKAGGVKLIDKIEQLEQEISQMFGKILKTHQTGPDGKEVKKVYVEEASDIFKEFYLSCLIDRESSKIAFISSTEGGVDIEKVAKDKPSKITTTKFDLKDEIEEEDINKIIKPFNFNDSQKEDGKKLIRILYKVLKEKDANLIEINPLIVTKDQKLKKNLNGWILKNTDY